MLKTLLTLLVCAALLPCAAVARAGTADAMTVRELSGVSAHVPEGWKISESTGGNNIISSRNVTVAAPDNATRVIVSLFPIHEGGARNLAVGVSERLKGAAPEAAHGGYVFSFTLDGQVSAMTFVAGKGNMIASVTRMGDDPRLKDVLASLSGTRPEERALLEYMRPGLEALAPASPHRASIGAAQH